MKYELGNQYEKDNPFKKKARYHQSKYRSETLKVDFDEFGNRLKESDAKIGLNFFNGFNVFNSVLARYPKYSKGLFSDMLRSEHIPFNIFIPLKSNLKLAKYLFEKFLPIKINEIIDIKIEFAPSPASQYLDDRTSFDTFIEYMNNKNEKAIIGIEVKYTEQEYKLKIGSKEQKDILNKNSSYHKISKRNIYNSENLKELPKDKYRQFWRNHLLGESMLLNRNLNYSEFTSVIIFPKGNLHFVETSKEYKSFLLPEKQKNFQLVTFEELFNEIEKKSNSNDLKNWVKYLKERYLFN